MNSKLLVVAALGFGLGVLACRLWMTRYTVTGLGDMTAIMVDNWTGGVWSTDSAGVTWVRAPGW